MAKNGTSFDKERQPEKRKPRSKGKKTLMLDAIRSVCGTEQEFLEGVVKAGLGNPKKDIAPNPALLTLVLNRIEPPLKSILPMVTFKFSKSSNVHDQACEILSAAAEGDIAPDVAKMLIDSISSMLKIQEVTDLEDRIKVIEAASEQD